MELRGFYVSVHSDGEQLKEYSVEISPDGKKATCWIPSQAEKAFEVKGGDAEPSDFKGKPKSVHIYADGDRMKHIALFPHDSKWTARTLRTADKACRPFVFAKIQTTACQDEGIITGNSRVKLDEIGTISVRMFVAESSPKRTHGRHRKYKVQDRPPAVINEQKKKAAEYCVSLGDVQPCATSPRYHSKYDRTKPELVFEFRHRSVAMLQALRIAPPPKRETPLVIDPKDEGDQPPTKRPKIGHDEDLVWTTEAAPGRLRKREKKKAGLSGVKKEVKNHEPGDIIDLT